MAGPGSTRLVRTALRCYPKRWLSRHGEEANEVASLLIRDGMPARSIAWSYFKGAARSRLALDTRRRSAAAAGLLLAAACALGVTLAVLPSSTPANAANMVRAHHPKKPASCDSGGRHGQHC